MGSHAGAAFLSRAWLLGIENRLCQPEDPPQLHFQATTCELWHKGSKKRRLPTCYSIIASPSLDHWLLSGLYCRFLYRFFHRHHATIKTHSQAQVFKKLQCLRQARLSVRRQTRRSTMDRRRSFKMPLPLPTLTETPIFSQRLTKINSKTTTPKRRTSKIGQSTLMRILHEL